MSGCYAGFIIQCSLMFSQQHSTYAMDKSKIAFIIGLLVGRAAQWAAALWDSHSPVLSLLTSFTDEMRKVFDHPVQGSEASTRLLTLKQGNRSELKEGGTKLLYRSLKIH